MDKGGSPIMTGDHTIARGSVLFGRVKWMDLFRKSRISRLTAGFLGFLLLLSGVLKTTDMVLFVKQMAAYRIIDHPLLLTLGAWGLVTLECGLGAALLLFYRPRIAVSVLAVLWLILLGGTSWAWLTGVTEDCGCYGAWVNQTPKAATLENALFLGLTVVAWAWLPRQNERHLKLKTWSVAAACLIGLLLPFAFGFPLDAMISPPSSAGPAEIGPVDITGLDVDLKNGNYLLVLMGTDCRHCLEAVPEIDILAGTPSLPKVIALSTNNEAQRKKFVEEFDPLFDIGQIGEEQFFHLLGNGDLPRVMLLQGGRIVKTWNRSVPDQDMVTSAISQPDLRSPYKID